MLRVRTLTGQTRRVPREDLSSAYLGAVLVAVVLGALAFLVVRRSGALCPSVCPRGLSDDDC
jgi:hypothetical protein